MRWAGRSMSFFLLMCPFSTAPCSVPLALLFRSRLLPTAHKDCPIQEFNWNLINPITVSHHPILSHRISNVHLPQTSRVGLVCSIKGRVRSLVSSVVSALDCAIANYYPRVLQR